MSKRKHKRPSLGAYVAVPKRITESPAWRAMSPWARLVWIDARAWLRNDWSNNGTTLHRSCRKAAEAIGCDKKTITRSFAELDHYGFVHKTAGGFLGSNGFGIAAKYRFTDLPCGTQPPTREYEQWDGELYLEPSHRPARKKQNPVPPHGTPRTAPRDIGRGVRGRFLCTAPRDIDDGPNCPARRDTSSLPLPTQGESTLRGSSTARAPAATAGGAGSSPAPVAKSDQPDPLRGPDGELTTMVLGIVRAQLDELEARRPPSSSPSASQDAVPPARKPWTTPTVTEISLDDLPTELRMLALGLPAPAEKQPEVPPRPAIYGQTRPRIYGAQCATWRSKRRPVGDSLDDLK
jgi:hypothetical protein